jgi:hypothetical protein
MLAQRLRRNGRNGNVFVRPVHLLLPNADFTCSTRRAFDRIPVKDIACDDIPKGKIGEDQIFQKLTRN